ncbi:SWIM zinc finger family protein [Streptomyces sp. NBC_00370]|uniref:SWIM zinc finger family protein n=1 Tax=Streptomyces sp. NBC_00370 TaxID=2975728 RepID=UPI002E2679C3
MTEAPYPDDTTGAGYEDDRAERVFAALPPAHGRGFAESWWGRSWLKALEDTALDGAQLRKGRGQARAGAVGAVSVRPGRITAVVRDRDGTGHRSDVLLRRLSDGEWDRFLAMAVERSGHIAALLDREMPPDLVEDAAAAGVELLPGIGDLEPECGCEAWDHCPHSAALCYQMARLLDQDPFVLLLMRGRSKRQVLDELQSRSSALAARIPDDSAPEAEEPGVPASAAFAAWNTLPPLPAAPAPPQEPGLPPDLHTDNAPPPELDTDALSFLAADAAARALRMLTEALAPDHEQQPLPSDLTVRQDVVRLAAAAPDGRVLSRLATAAGRSPADLDLAVRAWRLGGAPALAVLDGTWTPSPEALARARAVLESAWEDGERPALRPAQAGRWTVTGIGIEVQLRLAQDGRWWPYRKERGRWAPAGPAEHDPAAALALPADFPAPSPHRTVSAPRGTGGGTPVRQERHTDE